jgi:hypothetical protein
MQHPWILFHYVSNILELNLPMEIQGESITKSCYIDDMWLIIVVPILGISILDWLYECHNYLFMQKWKTTWFCTPDQKNKGEIPCNAYMLSHTTPFTTCIGNMNIKFINFTKLATYGVRVSMTAIINTHTQIYKKKSAEYN